MTECPNIEYKLLNWPELTNEQLTTYYNEIKANKVYLNCILEYVLEFLISSFLNALQDIGPGLDKSWQTRPETS